MKWAVILAGVAAMLASPVQAETFRVSGLRPAASDSVAAMRSIAVDRLGGPEGSQLAFLIEDQLRRATVNGQPWFAVLVPEAAQDADGFLQGYAEPRLTESYHVQQREACIARDDQGTCTARGQVEAECVTVHLAMRASFRLAAQDGRIVWSQDMPRAQDFAYCPEFDSQPQVDPVIDQWLQSFAWTIRSSFAPTSSADDTRILESRDGLARPLRSRLSAAIRLTERDPVAACAAFTQLQTENPQSATLTYNSGLCAESLGDWERARGYYIAAQAFSRSRERAGRGLWRISQHQHALRQIAMR